jgi:hypothetical protein
MTSVVNCVFEWCWLVGQPSENDEFTERNKGTATTVELCDPLSFVSSDPTWFSERTHACVNATSPESETSVICVSHPRQAGAPELALVRARMFIQYVVPVYARPLQPSILSMQQTENHALPAKPVPSVLSRVSGASS